MNPSESTLWKRLSQAVVAMDEDGAVEAAQTLIRCHYNAYDGIMRGLAAGMDEVGTLYEEEEYYIPELLLCSDAMYAGLRVLQPHLQPEATGNQYTAVVGVVEGDTHDIGKNLFKIMLETNGFTVTDLGRDVAPERFVQAARETKADVVGLSTLMTTTMDNMETVMALLRKEQLRHDVVVMVGGGPVSQRFADAIGADGYAPEASAAARLARKLVQQKRQE